MESKTTKSSEFDRFTSLVDGVLSVPKAYVERIKGERWTEDQKDRVLGYLRSDLEREEREKSQVSESQPSKERRLQDLRYLREELEDEERRKSQIIPRK